MLTEPSGGDGVVASLTEAARSFAPGNWDTEWLGATTHDTKDCAAGARESKTRHTRPRREASSQQWSRRPGLLENLPIELIM